MPNHHISKKINQIPQFAKDSYFNKRLPKASVVVIGRNEASNLESCIQSIRDMNYPTELLEILYVDTDSTDGSPEVARKLGITVFEEHSDLPSAGRARNRGFREANHSIIHFVDGDMLVARNYLRNAVEHLGKDGIACVIGKLKEKKEDTNWISSTFSYIWKTKTPGLIDAPGAGGTFLRKILEEVGGYNPYLLRGEETELGYKLRLAGYRILMIDEIMGTHDYDMSSLWHLFKHYYRMGFSFGIIQFLLPELSIAMEKRRARNIIIQCVLALLLVVFGLLTDYWWTIPLLPLLLVIYIIIKYWNHDTPYLRWNAILSFGLSYFFKPIMFAGIVSAWWYRLIGKLKHVNP